MVLPEGNGKQIEASSGKRAGFPRKSYDPCLVRGSEGSGITKPLMVTSSLESAMKHSTVSTLVFGAWLAFAFWVAPAFAQLETRSSTADPGSPQSLAVSDFNGDGFLDVAVSSFNGQLSVLLGNGDGTLRKPTLYSANDAYTVVSGDLRNNGVSDLVVTNPGHGSVSVLLGNGDGTFQPAVRYFDVGEAVFAALGDFNNDGNLDVVVDDEIGCYCITVLFGDGTGALGRQVHTKAPYTAQVLGVGDFNRDGNLDVVTAGQFGGTSVMGVLLGNGDGTFRTGDSYPIYIGPQSIVVADFNGDHILDVAVAEPEGGAISIFLGNGDGTFQQAPTVGAYFPGAIQS
jgi:hypothetical protein